MLCQLSCSMLSLTQSCDEQYISDVPRGLQIYVFDSLDLTNDHACLSHIYARMHTNTYMRRQPTSADFVDRLMLI